MSLFKKLSSRIFIGITLCLLSSQLLAQQNYTVSKTYLYDDNGQVKFWPGSTTDTMFVESRTYFDQSGKLLQSQSRLNSYGSSGIILGTQPIYDRFGRGAINTLPAPMGAAGTGFGYKPLFVRGANGAYDYNDFDKDPLASGTAGKLMNPNLVSNSLPYTLGWYYSESSTTAGIETDVPASQFPYTRTVFADDGSNEVQYSTMPGDVHRMGQGHEIESEILEINGELDEYLNLRHLIIPMDELIENKAALQGHIYDDQIRTDVLTANEVVHIAPTGTLSLEPGFNTNGFDFETIHHDVAYYLSLKEKGMYSKSTDPNGKISHVFADMNENVIATAYSTEQNTTLKGWAYNIYDDNQRLIASVSPNGVEQWRSDVNLANIDKTTYEYNHRGWLLSMTEPDAGTTTYMYRNDGKLRFSQTALQAINGKYSFTNYDAAGRPIESGELSGSNETILQAALGSIGMNGPSGTKSDALKTYYDLPATNIQSETGLSSTYIQDFLKGGVSYSENDEMITWYSYDDAGQMTWVLQKPDGLNKIFATEYLYDLNGNVLETVFKQYDGNPGVLAYTFTHKYTYDNDLRLIKVETKENSGTWNTQAEYEYYLHGPLKRVVLADGLQGLDYRYTVQGWLKSINHPEDSKDPGQDSGSGGADHKDAFGMTLEYFDGDYAKNFTSDESVNTSGTAQQLFDGNISAMAWKTPLTKWQSGVNSAAYAFNYDDKYQLSNATFGSVNFGTNTYAIAANNSLKVAGLSYDENGNIQQLNRYGSTGSLVDNFSYSYQQHKNKLSGVTNYANYAYDAIGQMTQEAKVGGEEQNLTYDVSGKVIEVRDENNALKVSFAYDDRGFRLKKTVKQSSGNDFVTWYIRDASGAVLATYDNKNSNGTHSAVNSGALKEVTIYGSGKLGTFYPEKDEALYELTDHLGNVRATVADVKTTNYTASFEDGLWPNQEVYDFDFPNESRDRIDNGSGTNKVARVPAGANGLFGPSKTLLVMPGDAINITVNGGYAGGSSVGYTANNTLLTAILTGLTGSQQLGEAMNTSIQNANPAAGIIASIGANTSTTKSYINWMYFDNDFNFKTGGFVTVPSGTAINNLSPLSLNIPAATIDAPGFVYIYTTNESTTASEAYFDDLSITHTQGIVRSTADYYPFGSQIVERSFSNISPNDYRFGYQGQFAEKDPETGWNSFELRMLDSRVGRWLSTDPAGQYASPYISMGSNPSKVDPDGGEDIIFMKNGKEVDRIVTSDPFDIVVSTWGFQGGSSFGGFEPFVSMRVYDKIFYSAFQLSSEEYREQYDFYFNPPKNHGLTSLNVDFDLLSLGGRKAFTSIFSRVLGKKSGSKAIVIGEGMGAVKTTVRELRGRGVNARWYQAWSKNYPNRKLTLDELNANLIRNERWINAKIKQGYKIYDIGIDPVRLARSPFYQMELQIISKHKYPVIKLNRNR